MKKIYPFISILFILIIFYLLGIACSPDEEFVPHEEPPAIVIIVDTFQTNIVIQSDSLIPIEHARLQLIVDTTETNPTSYYVKNYSLAENSQDTIRMDTFYSDAFVAYPDSLLPDYFLMEYTYGYRVIFLEQEF